MNQRLRAFYPVLAFVLVLLAGAGAWLYLAHGTAPGGGMAIGGPFALEDGAGHTVTDRDLRGRYLLVYFGYTFCPDVCPTTLNEVATALDKLGAKADRLNVAFITVDPQRDTPKVIHDYVAAFSPRIIGLTGTSDQIAKVAGEYRVYYAPHRIGEGAADYTVDHSSILYLMGPDGQFVEPIRTDETGEAMAADLAKQLK
jgi:protein SCO1/2